MLLARPSAATERLRGHPGLGLLLTPRGGLRAVPAVPFAADNDAYAGFHEGRFRRMLAALAGFPVKPAWVACPDVVGDATDTLRLFDRWEAEIRSRGLPVALVGQDGLTPASAPWDRIDALFVGGSTAWKESPDAGRLVAEAKRRGKAAHMGRCSTLRRIRIAARFGCDSIDSSCTATLPDVWVPKLLRWIGRVKAERVAPGLFDSFA